MLYVSGRVAEATAEAEVVLAEPAMPNIIYSWAELARLRGATALGNVTAARQSAEDILAGSCRSLGDAALAEALTVTAELAWDEGRLTAALSFARAAIMRHDEAAAGGYSCHPRLNLAAMSICLGEFDSASALIERTAVELEKEGDTLWRSALHTLRSKLALSAGRPDEAVVEARTGLASAEQQGTFLFSSLAWSVLTEIAVRDGDLGGAARLLGRDRVEQPPSIGVLGWAAQRWAEALVLEAQCGPARALELLEGDAEPAAALGRMLVEEPAGAGWWVRVALTAGDSTRARSVADAAGLLALANPACRSVRAAAMQARGLVERDPASLKAAADLFRHPWARGSAAEDAGVALAEGTDCVAAATMLEQAVVSYEQAGSSRDALRARRRLRDLNSRGRRRNGERPVSGWSSLTETEHRVALVVAEGLTNGEAAQRLFLSRHTVDFHLRQIFRKLDLTSRVGLARLVVAEHNNESA